MMKQTKEVDHDPKRMAVDHTNDYSLGVIPVNLGSESGATI